MLYEVFSDFFFKPYLTHPRRKISQHFKYTFHIRGRIACGIIESLKHCRRMHKRKTECNGKMLRRRYSIFFETIAARRSPNEAQNFHFQWQAMAKRTAVTSNVKWFLLKTVNRRLHAIFLQSSDLPFICIRKTRRSWLATVQAMYWNSVDFSRDVCPNRSSETDEESLLLSNCQKKVKKVRSELSFKEKELSVYRQRAFTNKKLVWIVTVMREEIWKKTTFALS